MKKIYFLLLISCLWAFGLQAQLNQVKIVSFTVKNQLPARVDDWTNTPGALLLTAQRVPGTQVKELKLLLQLKSNGSLLCGTTLATAPPAGDLTTRTFSTAELVGMLGNCKELKEGSYTLCAQFFNIDRLAVSQEMCRDFTVASPKETEYAPPTLITPDNGKQFTVQQLQQPIVFRWTPLVPKPKEPVTYRLKVWQLMQGQNGTSAMRSNQPLVEKDVTNVQQAVVNNLLTGPCRPPYLCDFIWQVQALNREGKPIGNNEGKSEPWTFKVQNNIDTEIDSVKVSCCEKGKQNIYIRVRNNLAGAVNIVAIKYKINGIGASITLAAAPAVPSVTIAGNGTQVFTASINCIDNLTTLKFLVDAEDAADPDNKETEVATDTLRCICNACDSVKINVPDKGEVKPAADGSLLLNTSISVSPKLVKSIKAELVYFEYKPQSDDCMICNKDSKTFGNFIAATGGGNPLSITYPHTAQWNSNSPNGQNVNGVPLQFTINMPPTVKCCAAEVKWCIRYVVTFSDCTVCNKLVCYSYNKKCDCK